LYTAPASAFVANFVGLSNRIPATVKGREVTVYGQNLALLGTAPDATEIYAMVRPEDITLTAGTAKGVNGTVVTSSFLGSFRRTQVRLDDDTVVAVQHDVATRYEPGDAVNVVFTGRPVSVAAKS
jgi:putative spermidine/putrescine transport system ATP-binding protein